MAQRPMQQSQQTTDSRTNDCLILVRALRSRAYKLHKSIFTALEERETPHEIMSKAQPLCRKLNNTYDEIEANSYNLPDKINSDKEKFERLKLLYQEEKMDAGHADLINDLTDACNYNEANFQINYFLSSFIMHTRRKNYPMIPHAVSYSKFTVANNPHTIFEQCLIAVQKEFIAKKMALYVNIVEKTSSSCIFELRSGNFVERRDTRARSHEFVCLQKAIVVENGGSIDQCSFYAPHEELAYQDDFGERRVDLRTPSRYEVYRRLSINANIHLLTNSIVSDPRSMSQILIWIAKVYQVISQPCKICNKVLKDFMPPTAFNDPRMAKTFHHESCR